MRFAQRMAVFLWLMTISAPAVLAQSSVVPASHSVYGWLLRQRVEGRLTGYSHETRPHDRGKILAHLHALASDSTRLTGSDRRVLDDYLSEFDFDLVRTSHVDGLLTSTDIRRSARRLFSNDRDPAMIAVTTADGDVDGAATIRAGIAAVVYDAQDGDFSAFTSQYGASAFLYSRSTRIGLSFVADDINIAGDKEIFRNEPMWAYAYEYVNPESIRFVRRSYRYEGVVSWRSRFMDADVGHGDLVLGSSIEESSILSLDAPSFGFARFRLGTPRIYITAIHGSLFAQPSYVRRLYQGDSVLVHLAPSRWVAMHRLTMVPVPRLEVSLFESTLYSFRGFDLNYLNPLAPHLFLEQDLGDRDNKSSGMDVLWRPVDGTELTASLMIDDMKSLPTVVRWDDVKAVYDFGVRQAVSGPWMLSAGYTRVGAHVYTHWTGVNAYQTRGRPLGVGIGPNAELWTLRLDGELPRRSRVLLKYQFGKKGVNNDPNDGGDMGDRLISLGTPLYAGSDLQTWNGFEIDLRTQPIRGFELSAQWKGRRIVRGDRYGDENWFRVMLGYGF